MTGQVKAAADTVLAFTSDTDRACPGCCTVRRSQTLPRAC